MRLRSLVASQTTYGCIMDDEEIQLLANLGLWLGDLLEFCTLLDEQHRTVYTLSDVSVRQWGAIG